MRAVDLVRASLERAGRRLAGRERDQRAAGVETRGGVLEGEEG